MVKSQIRALLLDFDGTLVHKDILSELVGMMGKKEEADRHAEAFQSGESKGLEGLIARINLLRGMSVKKIQDFVKADLSLVEGAENLLEFCRRQGIIVILATGTIDCVAEVYRDKLGIDYIVCSHPKVEGDVIVGISEDDYPSGDKHFKVVGIQSILMEYGIIKEECVAIGDGRGDIPMFGMARYKIALNPKGGIEQYADVVVKDLNEALEQLVMLINKREQHLEQKP